MLTAALLRPQFSSSSMPTAALLWPLASARSPALALCAPPAPDGDGRELSAEYLWPRALLLLVAVCYGTNFPVGRMMNAALPASATTSGRFVLAAAALSPFLPTLPRSLIGPALLCGGCDAVGYVAQSLALVDTPAAKVSFLGALTVVVCPVLAAAVDGKELGPRAAPQVWLAAALTLAGVALLELGGSLEAPLGSIGAGDAWAVLQAVAFGASFFIAERVMREEPGAALPVTALQCAVVAAMSAGWAALDGYALGPFASGADAGWLADAERASRFALPGMLLGAGPIGAGVLWTGLVSTALVRVGENTALARVDASDGSILVATEPLWAAAFGVALLGEALGPTDVLGGALVVGACVVSALEPARVRRLLPLWKRPP